MGNLSRASSPRSFFIFIRSDIALSGWHDSFFLLICTESESRIASEVSAFLKHEHGNHVGEGFVFLGYLKQLGQLVSTMIKALTSFNRYQQWSTSVVAGLRCNKPLRDDSGRCARHVHSHHWEDFGFGQDA